MYFKQAKASKPGISLQLNCFEMICVNEVTYNSPYLLLIFSFTRFGLSTQTI